MGKPSNERRRDADIPAEDETPAAAAYDAGDPAAVGERERQSKVRTDARIEGLRELMATTQGRAWMLHLLREKCQVQVGAHRGARMFTGNSTTFYNNALAEMGYDIKAEVEGLCPAEYELMKKEGGVYRA